MRHFVVAILLYATIGAPWIAKNYPVQIGYIADIMEKAGEQVAAVIHKPKTVAGLQYKYNISAKSGIDKVRVLVVPGHEPSYGGAEFGSLKERNMTVQLAEDLAVFLRNNGRYEVHVTRDSQQWSAEFRDYFENSWDNIVAWQKEYKKDFINLLKVSNKPLAKPTVYHNSAPENVALRLYGITKWANENDMDITIHIHFNDYPGHPSNVPGKYSGFAIYVPQEQFLNSTTTKTIAESIFYRLSKYNPVSDFQGEADGIVEEPDLIAVGAYNTSDAASMLIEYGYIYETQFTDPDTRDLAIKDLAFQTYLGLQDFFGDINKSALAYDTLMLPYKWQRQIDDNNKSGKDVLVLQTALQSGGLYPPLTKTKSQCPRTGTFGPCTKKALGEFQSKFGISDENGYVGKDTIEVLNREYGK